MIWAGGLNFNTICYNFLCIFQSVTDSSKREKDSAAWDTWLQQYKVRLELEVEGNGDLVTLNTERVKVMNSTNPR